MSLELLNLTIIQPDIVWENKAANLQQYEEMVAQVRDKHIVLLPEMFSTGFSMAPERLAEPMDGPTVQWMKDTATQHKCILTGSVIIEEDGHYYNRLIWVQPDGTVGCYDKRHLFAYAHEDEHYARGNKRLIAQVNGWRICLMVCYDLRFPVWARNQGMAYDVLVYVANWPDSRSLAWKTLLQARAIENMCFVAGVNRVGKDGKDILYSGASSVFSPLGDCLWQADAQPGFCTVTISKKQLTDARSRFPFLLDADEFVLL
jgi:omega-amidase